MGASKLLLHKILLGWVKIISMYMGGTQTLPCTVKDKVFLDFNIDQADKVITRNWNIQKLYGLDPSETNSLNNGGTGDIDKYVVYNYGQKIWYLNIKQNSVA